MPFRTPRLYHFSKHVKYHALQFVHEIPMLADEGDFLVVSNAGFQRIMTEEDLNKFYHDLSAETEEDSGDQ